MILAQFWASWHATTTKSRALPVRVSFSPSPFSGWVRFPPALETTVIILARVGARVLQKAEAAAILEEARRKVEEEEAKAKAAQEALEREEEEGEGGEDGNPGAEE